MTRVRKLIVGLGNPGPQYRWTRHNLGFLVLEALGEKLKAKWRLSTGVQGMVAKAAVAGAECALLMPSTFMNHSGSSVKKLAETEAAQPQDILIVCDDFALPFGKLRLRPSGSAGGHNGLKSIIHELGSQGFARLRMGIGSPRAAAGMVDHALSVFTPAQKKALPDFINHALDCAACWSAEGAKAAMNLYNRREDQLKEE